MHFSSEPTAWTATPASPTAGWDQSRPLRNRVGRAPPVPPDGCANGRKYQFLPVMLVVLYSWLNFLRKFTSWFVSNSRVPCNEFIKPNKTIRTRVVSILKAWILLEDGSHASSAALFKHRSPILPRGFEKLPNVRSAARWRSFVPLLQLSNMSLDILSSHSSVVGFRTSLSHRAKAWLLACSSSTWPLTLVFKIQPNMANLLTQALVESRLQWTNYHQFYTQYDMPISGLFNTKCSCSTTLIIAYSDSTQKVVYTEKNSAFCVVLFWSYCKSKVVDLQYVMNLLS